MPILSKSEIIDLAVQAGLLNYVDNETPRRYFISGYAELSDVIFFANSIINRIEDDSRKQTP